MYTVSGRAAVAIVPLVGVCVNWTASSVSGTIAFRHPEVICKVVPAGFRSVPQLLKWLFVSSSLLQPRHAAISWTVLRPKTVSRVLENLLNLKFARLGQGGVAMRQLCHQAQAQKPQPSVLRLANMSSQLVWQLVKNYNCFMHKGLNGVVLSTEPGNLYNKHSYKYSGTHS